MNTVSGNNFEFVNFYDNLKSLKDKIVKEHKDSKIVYTYGAWDLLHPGHIRFLTRAKKLGNFLIVGVISDRQISDFKGIERPIQKQDERIITVGSLRMVDAVIHQAVYDPSIQLEQISHIDILTKGDDWDYIPGAEKIQEMGGKLVKLGYSETYSTSKLVHKITN